MNKISVSQEKTLHTNHVNVFLNVKFNSYLFGHLMNSMWQSIEQIVQSEAIIQFEFFSIQGEIKVLLLHLICPLTH
jgi:hypothetical protein